MRFGVASLLLALSTQVVALDWTQCNTALPDGALLPGWQQALGGGKDVPSEYWGTPLKALEPIRVRVDFGNIAVMTARASRKESGIYFVLPGSRHVPEDSNARSFRCGKAGGQLEFSFKR